MSQELPAEGLARRGLKPGAKALPRRKAFLAEFLDDESLRDATKDAEMYQGPYAAGNFPRLQIRNMAAMQLAWLLELKP